MPTRHPRNNTRLTRRYIQRRATSFFEFELPSRRGWPRRCEEMITVTKKHIAITAIAVIGAITALQVIDRIDLTRHSRVTAETGLTLPEGTKIVATAAHAFSLADGDNYEWLVESASPLTPWIQSCTMHREDGDGVSWVSVKSFGEIADIARSEDRELALDSVWKSVKNNETAYLYVASGRRVALLATFRP